MKRQVTFRSCGLNAENNMLQAPICRCGCGEYANLVLEDKQDLCGFIHTMLDEFECEHYAIFALLLDGTVTFGTKFGDDIKVYGTSKGQSVRDCYKFVSEMQKDIQFHCYGLIEQIDSNLYRIVMD